MELKGLSSFDFAVVTVRRSLSGVTTFSSVQFSYHAKRGMIRGLLLLLQSLSCVNGKQTRASWPVASCLCCMHCVCNHSNSSAT